MKAETTISCRRCADPMVQIDQVVAPKDGPIIEVQQCERCELKVVLIFEPHGGLTTDQQTWVERVVGEKGSFFPTDFTQTRGPRFGHG